MPFTPPTCRRPHAYRDPPSALQDFDERDATRAAMLKDSDWQRDYIDAGRPWLANQVRSWTAVGLGMPQSLKMDCRYLWRQRLPGPLVAVPTVICRA